MTPEPSFVRDLAAYDPELRCRWARHSERWFIERKLPPLNPSWTSERPNPWGKGDRAKDLWESWREGYVHVMSVARECLHWSIVAPKLAGQDVQQAGSFHALCDRLEAAEQADEASVDRHIGNVLEDAASDAYDRLAWLQGRRVQMPGDEPAETPYEDHGGYLVRDRRLVSA